MDSTPAASGGVTDFVGHPAVLNLVAGGDARAGTLGDFLRYAAHDLEAGDPERARRALEVVPQHLLPEPKAEGHDETLVTLDQMAALSRLAKRTLERMKENGQLPQPHREGGGGAASLWRYSDLRLVIQPKARTLLPARFPG